MRSLRPVLSLAFLGGVEGVREGAVVSAHCRELWSASYPGGRERLQTVSLTRESPWPIARLPAVV
ncbi:MAG: hypothetical protein V8Q84_03285 [Bilophila sp.]